jgi:hypothetical protein
LFCVKLKETATETFEMLKSAYVEACLSRSSAFEWYKLLKEAQKVRMQKFAGENNVNCIFDAKGIIHHEFVPEEQTVNGRFHKEMIKRLIERVHCVSLSFRKVGPGTSRQCTGALFGRCFRVSGETRDLHVILSTLLA